MGQAGYKGMLEKVYHISRHFSSNPDRKFFGVYDDAFNLLSKHKTKEEAYIKLFKMLHKELALYKNRIKRVEKNLALWQENLDEAIKNKVELTDTIIKKRKEK